MHPRFGSLLPLLIALTAQMGCASWDVVDPSFFAPVPTHADSAAETLADEHNIRYGVGLFGQLTADESVHIRRRILRDDGRDYAVATIFYRPSFSDSPVLEARTVTPDGTVKTFTADDADDYLAGPYYALYTDNRLMVLNLGDVPLGSVVEWRYSIHWKQAEAMNMYMTFGNLIPTKLARLEISAPAGATIDYQLRQLNEPVRSDPAHAEKGGTQTWVWEEKDLPALRTEVYAPPVSSRVVTLAARLTSCPGANGKDMPFLKDARTMSAWLYSLMDPQAKLTPELKAQAASIVAGATTPDEKARRLYDWARKGINYCAVEIGIGGWVPHPADMVRGVRYGDCKDKANLLRALLSAVDIPSHIVAIQNHSDFPTRFIMPGWNGVFNHAILSIDLPAGPTLADPTAEYAPFGELPWSDQDADILPIVADGADVSRTPTEPPETEATGIRIDLAEMEDGLQGRIEVHAEHSRAMALNHLLDGVPDEKRGRVLGEALHLADFHLGGVIVTPPSTPDKNGFFVWSAELRRERVLDAAQRNPRLERLLSVLEIPSIPAEKRAVPYVLGMPHSTHEVVTLNMTKEMQAIRLPATRHIETPWLEYLSVWTISGRTLIVNRSVTIRQDVVAPADADGVRVALQSIHIAQNEGAVIEGAP